MQTKVKENIIYWKCCGIEHTYIATMSSVRELKHRCEHCGAQGKSWYEMNELFPNADKKIYKDTGE